MCRGASFTFPTSILSVSLSLRIFTSKFCITFCTRKLVSLLGPCYKTGQSNVKSEGQSPPFRILGLSYCGITRRTLQVPQLALGFLRPLSFPRSRLSARRVAADDLPRRGGLSSARPFRPARDPFELLVFCVKCRTGDRPIKLVCLPVT